MTFTDMTYSDVSDNEDNERPNHGNNNNSNTSNGENDDPKNIRSPLDQFQIRILFTFIAPAAGFLKLSLTNMGLFLTISTYINWVMTCMIIVTKKVTGSK